MHGPGHKRGVFGSLCIVIGVMLFGCSSPTSPTENPDAIVGLDVSCPSPLLLGESAPCLAVAIRRSGQNQVVSRVAAWSSARPAVVSVDGIGVAVGRAGGEARLSASYEGREGAVTVAVVEQDAVKVQAVSENGTFTPGSTVTMRLQGHYSVASADTGRLRIEISDQLGVLGYTAPMTVARGGAAFLLSSTFVVQERSTEVCRAAILEVGSTVVVEPTSNQPGWRCLPVRR